MGKRRRPQEQAHHRRIQLQRRAVEGQREARSNGKTIRRLLHGETRRHALDHRKQVRHERLRDTEAEQLTYQEREPHPGRLEDPRKITISPSLAHWPFPLLGLPMGLFVLMIYPLNTPSKPPLNVRMVKEAKHHDGGKQLLHG